MSRSRTRLVLLSGIIICAAIAWTLYKAIPTALNNQISQPIIPLREKPEGPRDKPVLAIWDKTLQRYGFINRFNDVLLPHQYEYAEDFNDGVALVKQDGILKFIDVKGKVIGLLGNRWGFIDKAGNLRIAMEFNEVHPFKNELTRVHIGGELQHVSHQRPFWKGGEWWIIDISGKKLHRCFDWEKSRFP